MRDLTVAIKEEKRDMVVLLLIVLVSAVVLFFAHNRGLDPIDDGYLAYPAVRVLAGQLPHVDFVTGYTGGLYFFHALVFFLFGVDIVNLRRVLVFFGCGIVAILFLLTRRIARFPFSLIPSFVFFIYGLPVCFKPYPTWYSVFFGLAALLFLFRFGEKGERWSLALSGILIGFSFLFKQTVGVYNMLASMLFLSTAHGTPRVFKALPIVFSTLLFFSMLLPQLSIDVIAIFLLPLIFLFYVAWFYESEFRCTLADCLYILLPFVATVSLMPLYYMAVRGPSAVIDWLYGVFVFPARIPLIATPPQWLGILPLIFIGTTVIIFRGRWVSALFFLLLILGFATGRHFLALYFRTVGVWLPSLTYLAALLIRGEWRKNRLLLGLMCFGVMNLFVLFPTIDYPYTVWSSAPALPVLAYVLNMVWVRRRFYALPAFALLGTFLIYHAVHVFIRADEVPLLLDGANVYMDKETVENLRGVVEFLRENADEDEIFVFPADSIVYLLAGRDNPTRYDYLLWGFADERGIDEIIRTLQEKRIKWVVADFSYKTRYYDYVGEHAADKMEGYLRVEYETVVRIGPYEIMRLR